MISHELNFYGVTLLVTGTFYKGSFGDRETPPEPREFEIDKVMIGEYDANDLLENRMEEIESEILNTYYS